VQEFAASTSVPPLRFGPWRIATPICYEAVRPDLVRRMVVEGDANLIVTLANDAWFGGSQEPWLHLHLARLRAVELRRYVVRATNSGVSALVGPTGDLSSESNALFAAALRVNVSKQAPATMWSPSFDWPGWLAVAITGIVSWTQAPRRRWVSWLEAGEG
jgi:apolipoprotein N-acyltransferase